MTIPGFRLVELTANRMSFVRISCDAKLFDKVPRSLYRVQGCCMLLRGSKKHDSRGGGEGVPTNLRGKLTESQLRKSKNLAKRRRQTNFTKFKAKKGSENRQNPAKATFGKKPLRERHFAKTCANDEDGSNTAPIPLILAKAYSELPFSMLNFLFKNH